MILESCHIGRYNVFVDLVISAGFYLLFFLVPLFFSASTSELFEYNKMVLTYGLTILIVGTWICKMVLAKKIIYKHTVLEIPLLLYLLSHLLSTVFSIDPHISIWGYYSRFHEGLLASISYILLYFAAVSNLNRDHIKKILYFSLASALIVSVWGIMEHFGNSPSCMLITGKAGVDCWVQDVQSRVYATLGQPNWMAAYLCIQILIILGFISDKRKAFSVKIFSLDASLLTLPTLFFAALLFTKSRSGILGLGLGLGVFALLNLKSFKELIKKFWPIVAGLVFVTILFGLPFAQTEKFSLENLVNKPTAASIAKAAAAAKNPDINISESGDIRKVVWTGALKVWQRYPIFGSGVETFGYSYYKDRPAAHNMLSEWDFLYNKAHNEYLNILATTGAVGFIAYALVIASAAWQSRKNPALLGAYVTILVTNFFGFSVVIIGLYFFLIPAFSWILNTQESHTTQKRLDLDIMQIGLISVIGFIGLLMELSLWSMWNADKAYALGKNYDSVQQYVVAYPLLVESVSSNPGEPTFRDELAYNQAVLAAALNTELKSSSNSAIATLSAEEKMAIVVPQLGVSTADLISQAVSNSNQVVSDSPNSLPFWKSRTKTFYQLGTIDAKYNLVGLEAIKKAAELAPTDAKVWYTYGLLLQRNGQLPEAIQVLQRTIELKPDYADAKNSLADFTSQLKKP